jgi:hypothetical protein
MSLHRSLYRAARLANNLDALTKPKRLPRRAKNVLLGRLLRPLWKVMW